MKKLSVPVLIVAAVLLCITALSLFTNSGSPADSTILSDSGDLIIPVEDISTKASFYQVNTDGTVLEVMAVKTPDGEIRTAFNTCQVCYSSGRGYYEQDGDYLICQNCLNRFHLNDVEIVRGGCNPIPISAEDKTVDAASITISGDFLSEYRNIFANWKTE